MARQLHPTSVAILNFLAEKNQAKLNDVKTACAGKLSHKDFYNYIFRLQRQELVVKNNNLLALTTDGKKLIIRLSPNKDGVWKLVIFDIPEKHKYVRAVLRAKLKQLHFKKWQNSIWVSPYKMDEEIEKEFGDLGKKFFVRLIKTTQINHSEDLEKMFLD